MADRSLPSEGQSVLGRYRLIDKLGVGASASVWRAYDRRLRREVALKLLHRHLLTDRAARRRLRAEANSTRRLDHRAIVGLLAAHLDAEQPALAFEYVPGETLAARLSRDGALERRAAASIAAELAEGLAHAHQQGVVHRDVKPSNVLLGEDGSVRLLDFGISSAAGLAPLTEQGMAVGTLPYMAPEQLAGRPADPATDVYGLGALLYEMLTGRPPYSPANPLDLAERQRTPPPPIEGPARPVGVLALAALRHDPTLRPTAKHVATAARALAEGAAESPTEMMPAVGAAVPAASGRHRARLLSRARAALPAVGGATLAVALGLAAVIALPEVAHAPGVEPSGAHTDGEDRQLSPAKGGAGASEKDTQSPPATGSTAPDKAAERDAQNGQKEADKAKRKAGKDDPGRGASADGNPGKGDGNPGKGDGNPGKGGGNAGKGDGNRGKGSGGH